MAFRTELLLTWMKYYCVICNKGGNKMKKILCFVLAVLMLCCVAGCGGNNPSNTKEPEDTVVYTYLSEIPTYADDKELEMVAFWSPPSTLEFYQEMVDCGFTSVVIDSKYGNSAGSQELLNTLAICDQVGIKAFPATNRGISADLSVDYSQYSSFAGFYTDEPLSKSDFDIIESNTQKLNDAYPDQDYFYLTTLISDAPTAYNNDFYYWEDYYNYYFEHSGNEQKAFLFDHYPLMGNATKGNISEEWLRITEQYALLAKEKGIEIWPYIATMSYASGTRRRPEEDDMRYQSYVNLAYGAKGLAYFCYMTPGLPPYDGEFKLSDYALINYEDPDDISTYYKTDTWYATQTVNNELKAFDHVLLSFDWQGVIRSAGSEAATSAGKNCFKNAKNWVKQHDGIKSINSTEDTIIGIFKDANGYDGFLLVNFSDPLYDCTDTVNLQFRGATRAVVYIGGEQQIVELADGAYNVTLQPGEAQFIIPLA